MKEYQELPCGWINVPLSKLTNYIQRGKSPKYADHSDLPVLNQKCVRWHGVDLDHIKYVDQVQKKSWTNERFLQPKDILWNSTGTGTIGRACLYKPVLPSVVVDSHVTIIRANQAHISPEYLFYFIMSPFIQKKIEQMQSGSTNQVELSKTAIENTIVPTPPLAEQKRIVDKIERLFSYLDKGEALLKQIQQQLTTYRQAILKAAVTGELTKEWREANRCSLESGDKLLERILEGRRKNWQGHGKCNEPSAPDKEYFSGLPEGWVWSTVGSISTMIQYGYTASTTNDPIGPKILRITDIQNNKVNWVDVPYCEIQNEKLSKYLLKSNDLVFARTGATVGKSFLIEEEIDNTIFASYLIRVQLNHNYNQKFLWFYFQSSLYWQQIFNKQSGTGQPNFNGQKLGQVVIPIPPRSEQDEIVSRIESIFSLLEIISKDCENKLYQCKILRQSILKSAFSGKLVEQDPNDEPAGKLLARIKAEKSSNEPLKTKRERKQLQGTML